MKYKHGYFTIEECKEGKIQEFLDEWSEKKYEVLVTDVIQSDEHKDAGVSIFMIKQIEEFDGIEEGEIKDGGGMSIG